MILCRKTYLKGHFLEGKPRGQGTMVHSDGTVEEDVWQDDIDWMEKKD